MPAPSALPEHRYENPLYDAADIETGLLSPRSASQEAPSAPRMARAATPCGTPSKQRRGARRRLLSDDGDCGADGAADDPASAAARLTPVDVLCWSASLALVLLLLGYAVNLIDIPDLPINREVGGAAWRSCCARFGCAPPAPPFPRDFM